MRSDAAFSPCRTWRYMLVREWDTDLPLLNVIGLNPSTADERQDDPTIRRCIGFARAWGCGRLIVTNLFAYRATDPRQLRRARDPVGPRNDFYLRTSAWGAEIVLAAWGTGGALWSRGDEVTTRLRDLGADARCLGTTKGGHPRHPLYVRADVRAFRYAFE